ncbi:MAG: CpaF family protein [Actinomycetes bacterium]|jgi:pilus assembly protein CpaF|nr:CpaF family protein [Actinomycetes bacterium]
MTKLMERIRQQASPVAGAGRADADGNVRLREQLRMQLYRTLPPTRIAELLAENPVLARGEVESILSQQVVRITAQAGCPQLSRAERDAAVAAVVSEVLGLGPIDRLLADPTIDEVMVNGPDRVFYERAGKLLPANETFSSEEQLRGVIDRIISPLGRRIDEQSPMVNGRLASGHRVNAVIPPVSLTGPLLTIRKFRERIYSLDELVAAGSVAPAVAQLLRWAVAARKNIAVSGGTGSGKTTLLNALSLEIGVDERIVTIEDSAELRFQGHPHVLRLEARTANLEGKGAITIRDLVINSLRMRPDRIIVGEVRGAEALEMLQAMNTGHDGSLTTLHANEPREVITRLVTMVGYGVDLPLYQVQSQIAAAFDLIVHLSRMADGTRRITHVDELCALHAGTDAQGTAVAPGGQGMSAGASPFHLKPLYRLQATGRETDGRVTAEHRLQAAPAFMGELVNAGLADECDVARWMEQLSC